MGIFDWFNKKQVVLRVDENETNDIDDITYYKGKPFSGIAFGSFDNGTKFETEFKEGLKHGLGKEFYNNGQLKSELKYDNDQLVEVMKSFKENGEQTILKMSTESSRKRLTYILINVENDEIIQSEHDSYSKINKYGEGFYSMNDWNQILFIVNSIKQHTPDNDNPINKLMFLTWLGNEYRCMDYSLNDKFKLSLSKKLTEYYSNTITLEKLNNYFADNVIWKNTKSEDDIDEGLYYFEKVIHMSPDDNEFTEFAVWSCCCGIDSNGEWNMDEFEKIDFIVGKFFDHKKNEIAEEEFDKLFNDAKDSHWSLIKINNNLDIIKNYMNDEISKSFNKSANYERDNDLPGYENVLGVELFKKDLSGLKAYCEERENMGDLYKELTHYIRNGMTVKEFLSKSGLMNDNELREIAATGFWDISNFLKEMLDIKDNNEVKKDYDACLEAIKILKDV